MRAAKEGGGFKSEVQHPDFNLKIAFPKPKLPAEQCVGRVGADLAHITRWVKVNANANE